MEMEVKKTTEQQKAWNSRPYVHRLSNSFSSAENLFFAHRVWWWNVAKGGGPCNGGKLWCETPLGTDTQGDMRNKIE